MAKEVFISLPVANLSTSVAFYQAIGFAKKDAFSNETGAGMIWSDVVMVMLVSHQQWRIFTKRPIADADHSEMSINLSLDSRAAVDAMIQAAADHGGKVDVNPVQDLGFMYSRDFIDLDGHVFGALWMDPNAGAEDEVPN